MIANAGTRNPQASSRKRNDKFLSMLPEIQQEAAFAFRELTVEAREELVQEVVATAYQLFHELAQRGKTGLAYATPLATFAIGHVRSGRRIGSRRNMQDVTSRCRCARNGVVIKRLDGFNRRRGESIGRLGCILCLNIGVALPVFWPVERRPDRRPGSSVSARPGSASYELGSGTTGSSFTAGRRISSRASQPLALINCPIDPVIGHLQPVTGSSRMSQTAPLSDIGGSVLQVKT